MKGKVITPAELAFGQKLQEAIQTVREAVALGSALDDVCVAAQEYGDSRLTALASDLENLIEIHKWVFTVEAPTKEEK